MELTLQFCRSSPPCSPLLVSIINNSIRNPDGTHLIIQAKHDLRPVITSRRRPLEPTSCRSGREYSSSPCQPTLPILKRLHQSLHTLVRSLTSSIQDIHLPHAPHPNLLRPRHHGQRSSSAPLLRPDRERARPRTEQGRREGAAQETAKGYEGGSDVRRLRAPGGGCLPPEAKALRQSCRTIC